MVAPALERQRRTLEFFIALRSMRPSWAGSLLFGLGLNETGRSLALASLAAGAASLFLEPDDASVRAANREGCISFVVSSLDEAIRALKNEIRQGRAITVALTGDAAHRLQDMVKRGLQPQALALAKPPAEDETLSMKALCQRGATHLHGLGLDDAKKLTPLAEASRTSSLQLALHNVLVDTWHMREQYATSSLERRAEDAALLAATPKDGFAAALARNWLRAAPSLFPRALDRVYLAR